MNPKIEDELRDELRHRADGLPARPDPYTDVSRRIVRSNHRRRAGMVVCAVIVLVTAVLAGPGLLDIGRRDAVTNRPSFHVDGTAGSPLTWPARGSLADDQVYVSRAAGWLAKRAGTKSDVNVLYAGDVAGKRLVVGAYPGRVSGSKPRPVEIVSLVGPAGSTKPLSESPMPWATGGSTFDHLASVLLPAEAGKRDRRPVVLVFPDAAVRTVSYSKRPEIKPTGEIQHAYSPLVDEDSEPGVLTAHLDDEQLAPGALRIVGETSRDPGVRGPIADFTGTDDHPRTLLREMADQVGGTIVPELAPALQMLELTDLGYGQIKTVAVPWPGEESEWLGLQLGTYDGGVVEAVLSTSPSHVITFEGTGAARQTVVQAVRSVPADQAGRVPFFWQAPEGNGCRLNGYVPEQLAGGSAARVAAVDVLVNRASSKRVPVAAGQLVVVDYCGALMADAGSAPDVEVRLLTEDGRELWTGSPVPRYDDYLRTLDLGPY